MLQVTKSLKYGSKAYWDSVFAQYDSARISHDRWRDSMEALEETPYVVKKELFATDAQYYIIPAAVAILLIILIFGAILAWDGRQAERAKKSKKTSILNYRENETKTKKTKKVR